MKESRFDLSLDFINEMSGWHVYHVGHFLFSTKGDGLWKKQQRY